MLNVLCLIVMTLAGAQLAETDVIIDNETGLKISEIDIDSKNFHELKSHEKMLVTVTPQLHHLRIVLRGGADIDWDNFDFNGIHEIVFEREKNRIKAHYE